MPVPPLSCWRLPTPRRKSCGGARRYQTYPARNCDRSLRLTVSAEDTTFKRCSRYSSEQGTIWPVDTRRVISERREVALHLRYRRSVRESMQDRSVSITVV